MHAAGLATMACHHFDFRDVKKQYSDHGRGMQKPDVGTLKLSLPGQGQIYIIVDALDE
jgi:hypothetical protein